MHRPLAAALTAFAILAAGASGAAEADGAKPFDGLRGDRSGGWLAQSRSEVVARHGVVATSHPLAAEAGLDILKQGGNAFDAAVATAAVLNLVEPESAGIGGDVFVLAWSAKEHRLIALNGAGKAPTGATPEAYAARGSKRVPLTGIYSATIPGAVDGWDALLKREGTMTFKQVLEPAAKLAEEGVPVSERWRQDWFDGVKRLKADPDSARTYLVNGEVPPLYSVFKNPDLARAFRALETGGRDAFYKGEIARAIVAKSRALGGTITLEDLAATRADWVTPISTSYRGYDVYELPPSTQGFAVLEMLNIVEACGPRLGVDLKALGQVSPAYWHFLVEAKKIAYADLYKYNGDPAFTHPPVDRLISKAYAATLCGQIDMKHAATPDPTAEAVGGTVYLSVADKQGNMVSFIYSVYDTYGSGVTVPGYGFVLNDRAALFSIDPKSPNAIAPGKRPFHTLIPGFLMKDGQPRMAFGLMGGGQQAQGHLQVLVDMLDLGANPQAATDAARFSHYQRRNVLTLESELYKAMGPQLQALGHAVKQVDGTEMGGYQSVTMEPGGSPQTGFVFRGASDHRKDGEAVGY
jgi:gamma-glutamyltranspeptidase/glutathione hydrolase